LFGAKLQTKSCVLCGKKEKPYHCVKSLLILPPSDAKAMEARQGTQRGGKLGT